MRIEGPILALTLTGCLALTTHNGPWPCRSDADCTAGQTCESDACQDSSGDAGSAGDAGGNKGMYCCAAEGVDDSTFDCQCSPLPAMGCTSSSDAGASMCNCGVLDSQTESGATSSCSLPTLQWTACCLGTLGTCNCYLNSSCDPEQEEEVGSCTGSDCSFSGDACECVGSGSGAGQGTCDAVLTPTCCQSASECLCDYDLTCDPSEKTVSRCDVAALQLPNQCDSFETAVASCP